MHVYVQRREGFSCGRNRRREDGVDTLTIYTGVADASTSGPRPRLLWDRVEMGETLPGYARDVILIACQKAYVDIRWLLRRRMDGRKGAQIGGRGEYRLISTHDKIPVEYRDRAINRILNTDLMTHSSNRRVEQTTSIGKPGAPGWTACNA